MNRSGCRLKPLAPRPAADTYAASSALSSVSLDPKDYVYPHADYVWGVPQQMHPGVLQQSHGIMNPFVAANTGVYGTYGPVVTSQWGQQGLPHYQPNLNPPTTGKAAAAASAQAPTSELKQLSVPQTSTCGAEELAAKQGAQASDSQVVPKLEGVDELLNLPLDEECLQKLLSGDEPDDVTMALDLGPDQSSKECGDLSGDSTCTAEGSSKKLGQRLHEEGDSTSGADDLLTNADISFGAGESSMLKHVSSFGDLDLEYLTSMSKPESPCSHDMLHFCSLDSAAVKRSDALTRAKSEAAIPEAARSPLHGLGREAALQSILDYLSSVSLKCTPSAERAAAVSAVRSLQQACSAAAIPEELGQQTGAVLKRKRSQPVRSSSMKALKSEAGDMVIS